MFTKLRVHNTHPDTQPLARYSDDNTPSAFYSWGVKAKKTLQREGTWLDLGQTYKVCFPP